MQQLKWVIFKPLIVLECCYFIKWSEKCAWNLFGSLDITYSNGLRPVSRYLDIYVLKRVENSFWVTAVDGGIISFFFSQMASKNVVSAKLPVKVIVRINPNPQAPPPPLPGLYPTVILDEEHWTLVSYWEPSLLEMLCIKICSKILNNEMVSILQNSDEGKFAGSKGLEGNSNHG